MPVTPNDLTRQQLDELDALLQRMLSVPVGQAPEPPPVMKLPELPMPESVVESARIARADLPAQTTRQPHLVEESLPPIYEFPQANRLFGPPTADTGVPNSTDSIFPQTSRFEASPLSTFINEEDTEVPLGPEPVDLTPAPEAVTVPVSAAPGVPVHHWPLFGVNWILENTLKLFGPLGDVSCSAAGKFVLGWSGIALLAAAGVWSAKGMGWIDANFNLGRF